jgi:hypothetical protein
MAATLPAWNIKLLNPFGFLSTRQPNRWVSEVSLNPGEFSVKEHILIGVLAGCASSAAYAGDIVAVQDLYYHVSKKKKKKMQSFQSLAILQNNMIDEFLHYFNLARYGAFWGVAFDPVYPAAGIRPRRPDILHLDPAD